MLQHLPFITFPGRFSWEIRDTKNRIWIAGMGSENGKSILRTLKETNPSDPEAILSLWFFSEKEGRWSAEGAGRPPV